MRPMTMLLGLAVISSALLAAAGGPVPIAEIVPDFMPGDVELAVIPQPKQGRYGDRMIHVGKPAICAPEWEALRAGKTELPNVLGIEAPPIVTTELPPPRSEFDTLVLVGHPDRFPAIRDRLKDSSFAFSELLGKPNSEQGYILFVRHVPEERRNLILIASVAPQGAFYAIQTLKQLAYKKEGKTYIREANILDWPTFPARGTKRTVGTWEYALKSNFHYSSVADMQTAREHFADWWMPLYAPVDDQKQLDATPAGLQKAFDWLKTQHNRGAKDYVIHLDDQPRKMTPATAELFGGNYQAAVAHLLREFYKAMRQTSPTANLYFMPEPYYTISDFEDYARKMREGGGIPEDIGMHLCGPQVTSRAMPPDDIADYFAAFGTKRRGLIYDNHLRDLDFGPAPPRPAALANYIIGISPERGTATTRATRLDWAWNPEAYDPERSLLLACRELAGFENWRKAYEMVSALENALPGPNYEPREKALAKFERSLERCGQLIKELSALPNGGMNGRLQPHEPAAGAEHPFRGLLDEVMLLNSPIAPQQVEQVMNSGVKAFYNSLEEQAEGISRKNFVGIWLFDDDPSDRACDLTPNHNDALVRGGEISHAPGRFGKALNLSGTGRIYLEVPHRPNQALSRFTIAAWVKMQPSGQRYQAILHKKNEKGQRNYSLIVECEQGIPYVDIWPAAGPSAGAKVLDDRWHHLAATHDGNACRIYVDGKLAGETRSDIPLQHGDGPIFLGVAASPQASAARFSGVAGNLTEQLPRGYTLLAETRRDLIMKHSFKEVEAIRVATPPKLDGMPDERAWQAAPEAGHFVISGKGELLPENQQTYFRCLYNDSYLYISLRFNTPSPLKIDPSAKPVDDLRACASLGKPEAFALMLDPKHTHLDNFQFEADYMGNRADARYHVASAESPQGLRFNSGWRTAVKVGDAGWTAEIEIPFKALGVAPAPGMVMGLQIWRGRALWSYMPRWWGMQEPSQSGHLILK